MITLPFFSPFSSLVDLLLIEEGISPDAVLDHVIDTLAAACSKASSWSRRR
jgi:hypothetical protein